MVDQKLRFRIGLFVLIVLVALAVLLYLFGLFPNVFTRKEGTLYLVEFTDAPNVTVNTPIRRSGVKIGQVEKVELDDETGRVLVTARIDRRHTLRRNEEPTLTTGMLSGDTSIDLVPREIKRGEPDDRTPVEPGGRVDGRLAASMTRFLDRASAVVPPAQEALGRISLSLNRLERMMPLVEQTLEEYRLLARDTRQAIPGVRQTNDEVQKLARELNRSMPDLRATNTALQRLIGDVNKMVPDIQKTVAGINDTIPDVQRVAKETASTIPEIRNLAKSANATMPDVQQLVKSINAAIPEVQKVVQAINESVPLARDVLKEASIAVKNWGVTGERASVLIQTNEKVIGDVLKNIERTVGMVGETFSLENRNSLTTFLRNFSEGSKRFPGIADEMELFLRQGRATTKRLDEGFDQLFRTMQPGSTAQSGGIIKNLGEAMEKLNRTMSDVQDLMRVIGRSDGTLRRFIADPALFNHADDAALMVTRLMPRIDRMLKDLEVFADKLARHPESIGLGGVVRPSSGIKEPPRTSQDPRP